MVTGLFDRSDHNPSFHAVSKTRDGAAPLLDFCVPANQYFPPPALLGRITANLEEILKYYPGYAEEHQKHIAALTGFRPDTIVPANGSTEIITALCREAAGPFVSSVPTFGRWTSLPSEFGIPFHAIQRRKENLFRLEVDEVVRRVRKTKAKTLVLSNPNNPTGAAMPLDHVTALARELADLHTLVIDESFLDFSSIRSAASLVTEMPHLVVVRSMGKSLGWHGIRLGYALAEPARAARLRASLPLWNINGLAAFVLENLPEFRLQYEASFTATAADRNYLTARLTSRGDITVYPSHANFVFVELPDHVSGAALRDRLLVDHGVMIRETSNKLGSSGQFLRIAVRRKASLDILIRAFGRQLAEAAVA